VVASSRLVESRVISYEYRPEAGKVFFHQNDTPL
jgi:hypothetical protein